MTTIEIARDTPARVLSRWHPYSDQEGLVDRALPDGRLEVRFEDGGSARFEAWELAIGGAR
jgi:hypothetical protein